MSRSRCCLSACSALILQLVLQRPTSLFLATLSTLFDADMRADHLTQRMYSLCTVPALSVGTRHVWWKPRGRTCAPQKPPTAGDGLRYCLEQLFEERNNAPRDCVSLFPVCGGNISVCWDWLERCHVTVIDIDSVFPISRRGYTATSLQPLPRGNLIPATFAVWIATKLSQKRA